MTKHLLYYAGAIALAILLISGTLGSGGSGGKFTGSPLDGKTCTMCHTGADVTEVSWISSDIPESGWVPKETYTLTLNGMSATAAKMGFEITAENETEKVGTFTFSDEDKMKWVNQNNAVTHTSNGTALTDGEITWEVQWTAPDVDKGDITFYAVFNAANGNSNPQGDSIFSSNLTFEQDASTTAIYETENIQLKVYPNPASDFLFVQTKDALNHVSIVNLNGQKVKHLANNTESIVRLDLSDLKSGVYIVNAKTESESYTRKIRVQ